MNATVFDRRAFLRRAGRGSMALALTGGALAACSSDEDDPAGGKATTSTSTDTGTSPTSDTPGGDSPLPIHVPYEGVTPDIKSQNDNVLDGFLSYPDPPVDTLGVLPRREGKLTALAALSIVTPTPMSRNSWWKNINSEIGTVLDLTMVPAAEYNARFTTMVAGGQLPEIARVPAVPNLDRVLESEFHDLAEWLGGESVKKYTMLANLPTTAWKGAIYNGKLFGVPRPGVPVSKRLEARTDIVDDLGLSIELADGDAFVELCRELTDERLGRWAMAQPINDFTKQMCGVPNKWSVQDGEFVRDVETDEFKRWLALVKQMWSDGLFHPDSFANPQLPGLFQGRHFCLFEVGGEGFTQAMPIYRKVDPDLEVAPVAPPQFDGGGTASVYLGAGVNGITAINKKVSSARVEEILTILDFLAAPFGTTQYLDTNFGAKGTDYTWQKGLGPILTEAATHERIVANFLPGTVRVNYSPGFNEVTKVECSYEAEVAPGALDYPTVGLYSGLDSTKGATLNKAINAACSDIIQGHKGLDSWDGVVRNWRSGGGDQIRKEYEAQYELQQ